jgi:transglutaminase-like putative cysteine protease
MQVIAAGYASCTGLSIFLVDALRAVGIPARVTGDADFFNPITS